MRVILVSENRCRENLIPFPLGVACVAAAVRAAGHQVLPLDLMFSEDPAAEVAGAVEDFQPHCVGMSVRNIDNQDMHSSVFYPEQALPVVEAVRSATGAPMVLGGAGFSIFPLECLDYFGLELGVVGEAEGTFVRLLDALEKGEDPADLPGVAVRRPGLRRVNPHQGHLDLDLLPPPERTGLGVEAYDWIPGRTPPFVANLQARRGCPMRCIYCPNPLIEGRRLRLRRPGAVADELERLEKEHGITTVFFTDSLFNHPLDYTFELLEEIASRRLDLRWGCSVNPAFHRKGLYERLRNAGCFHVSLGNESGSERMLRVLRKDFGREEVSRAVREAKAAGIRVQCFLLLGGPGENRDTVRESVDLLDELKPDAVSVTPGIRIYPGCALNRLALEEGVLERGRSLLKPVFYVSREVKTWLGVYLREVCEERPGWTI